MLTKDEKDLADALGKSHEQFACDKFSSIRYELGCFKDDIKLLKDAVFSQEEYKSVDIKIDNEGRICKSHPTTNFIDREDLNNTIISIKKEILILKIIIVLFSLAYLVNTLFIVWS